MLKTRLFRPVVTVMNRVATISKTFSLPGFEGVALYNVGTFFFHRFATSELQTRSRALAFSSFLALFPTIIFIFTLIPYIPIENFQDRVLALIQTLMPANTYETTRITIEDIVKHQRGGLLSFGFLAALFISSDGIRALMRWFNKSYHGKETRPAWKIRLLSIGLTLFIALLVTLAIALIITSELVFYYLSEKKIFVTFMQLILLHAGKWIILVLLCFSAISLLYYFGPSKSQKTKFISAGSSLATLLIIATTLGFNFFITHFGQYNKVYGSIGTLIIILVWLYINSLVLLIGFELNVSIQKAGDNKINPLPPL